MLIVERAVTYDVDALLGPSKLPTRVSRESVSSGAKWHSPSHANPNPGTRRKRRSRWNIVLGGHRKGYTSEVLYLLRPSYVRHRLVASS